MDRKARVVVMVLFFLFVALVENSIAEEMCLSCHEDLTKGKSLHPALQMGCTTCHTALDASRVPHRITNSLDFGLQAKGRTLCFNCHDKTAFTHRNIHPAINVGCTACHNPHSSNKEKLLTATPPELCYNCHNKRTFERGNVHPALQMGCTACHNPHSTETEKLLVKDLPDVCFNCHDSGVFQKTNVHVPVQAGLCTSCHNPHSSRNRKLLNTEPPELCYNCHDKRPFTKKNIHPPVQAGQCTTCHSPHSSDEIKLLVARPVLVCLRCHGDVRKAPHAVVGFSRGGHPIGSIRKPKKKKDIIKDPMRPDREFYCGSCHDPHSSDWMRLFRYKASSPLGICSYCHKQFF